MVKSFLLGFPLQTKLHWVRIYFDTPTFDRITKDEKANSETKLTKNNMKGENQFFISFSLLLLNLTSPLLKE